MPKSHSRVPSDYLSEVAVAKLPTDREIAEARGHALGHGCRVCLWLRYLGPYWEVRSNLGAHTGRSVAGESAAGTETLAELTLPKKEQRKRAKHRYKNEVRSRSQKARRQREAQSHGPRALASALKRVA